MLLVFNQSYDTCIQVFVLSRFVFSGESKRYGFEISLKLETISAGITGFQGLLKTIYACFVRGANFAS